MTTRARAAAGIVVWLALVGVAIAWGWRVAADRPGMHINAAPFVGTWRVSVADRGALLRAVLLGAGAVVVAPIAARRLPWRGLVLAAGLLAVGWLVALNAVDGHGSLRRPLTTRYEYASGVPQVHEAGGGLDYLRSFTDHIADYPTHVRGHPPGLVVTLWAFDELGVEPVDAALGLVLVGWAVAVGSALVAVREVQGEASARRLAPLLALLPAAVWAGTSADAFFAGLTALAITTLVLATGRSGRRADALAGLGGVLVGAALLMSYATPTVLLVAVAVAVARRDLRVLAIGGLSALAVLLATAGAGFWWLDGLTTTRAEYRRGLSRLRPFPYFVLGNLAAVALAVGPALGAGVATLGRRAAPIALPVGALVGVLAADLSGLSKGEVERIWLVFVPWLATAAADLEPSGPGLPARLWPASSVVVGLALQVGLRSPW